MAIRKKIVWLPYDFDTAIGINNEGALVFDYELEDIDHLEGGADVFNGQDSVIWKNIRAAFFDELRAMYQELRSNSTATTGLSYSAIEKMFEDHQSKWSEAIFNEDAQFKYLDPLINPSAGKEPTAAYLSMLQGSKAEQRKWWLYNRFRYIDSKYNAGDALTDYIQVRGYAKSNITITPYADIYPTVKFGSYLVSARGKRTVATTLICPLDNVNDTEIYIYSASQLADVGDLSGLKVGFADFSMATKLQNLKLGDSGVEYTNPNLKELYLGNNVLLKTIDIRNCTALGTGDQKSVSIAGCTNVEEVYFDNTKISSLTLPNGGVLRVLHLPNTITNLTIMNQRNITDLVADVSNVSTLRIENCPTVNTKAMLSVIAPTTRVRFVGFTWEAEDSTEIESILDTLDTMRGLDINGNNLEDAYVEGIIHTTSLTGEQIASYNERYPYLRVTADYVESTLTLKTWDGSSTIDTITCYNGVPQEAIPTPPARTATAQYNYTAVGWSTEQDAQVNDPDATTDVIADRTVYAAYSRTVRTYTVTWKNGTTTIRTDSNVPYGSTVTWGQSMPTNSDGQTAIGWDRDLTQPITGNTTITATYKPMYTITFVRASADGGGTLQTVSVEEGQTPAYTGSTPTTTQGDATDYPFEGWTPTIVAATADATYTAKFGSPVEVAEITDSWDTIIANIDNGTYASKYKVGNYKPLDLGSEGTINMQIVAKDADELADGSGTAPLTFIGIELLASDARQMNTTADSKWETCTLRTYLENTIKALIPSNVRSRINKVVKHYRWHNGTSYEQAVSLDNLWLPSAREIVNSTAETSGPLYTKVFSDKASRIKHRPGTSTGVAWWGRTAASPTTAFYYDTNGSTGNTTVTNKRAVCLCFCLGLEPETITDDWDTILANTNYSTDYSIGDTKYLDLGTEGKHLMEIVAFDADDKADGTGKAGITWISKTVLNTNHRMNPGRSGSSGNYTEGTGTIGGWDKSEMKSYILTTIAPLVPQNVRNAVKSVKKYTYIYNTSGTPVNNVETAETFWLPSESEVNLGEYETTGPRYSETFPNNASHVKSKVGASSASAWWLRSANNTSNFRCVDTGGSSISKPANDSSAVVLGFCTN